MRILAPIRHLPYFELFRLEPGPNKAEFARTFLCSRDGFEFIVRNCLEKKLRIAWISSHLLSARKSETPYAFNIFVSLSKQFYHLADKSSPKNGLRKKPGSFLQAGDRRFSLGGIRKRISDSLPQFRGLSSIRGASEIRCPNAETPPALRGIAHSDIHLGAPRHSIFVEQAWKRAFLQIVWPSSIRALSRPLWQTKCQNHPFSSFFSHIPGRNPIRPSR